MACTTVNSMNACYEEIGRYNKRAKKADMKHVIISFHAANYVIWFPTPKLPYISF